MEIKNEYMFRVKRNSKLEHYIDIALAEYSHGATQQDFKADNPEMSWNMLGALDTLGRYADNFTFSRQGISYTDVTPRTTIIEQAQDVVATSTPQQPSEPVEAIRWPDTPYISDLDKYDWFRKPSWYDRMGTMVDQGKHISLAGPPGIGKSSAVEYLAAERSKVLVNISSDAGLRRRDLTGNTELVNSHTRFDVAEYAAAAILGWWVKIDEVNAAEPDALMYLNSQIAPPYAVNFHGKSYPVHPDFRLFITYNPGLVGTKPLPESFKDRFFPIKLAFPNRSQLRRMLEANGMPESVVWANAIVEFGMEAWEAHTLGRMRYQITPRRLMDAVTLVQVCDENVIDALEAAAIQAVDNIAESRVLKEVLNKVKKALEFGRI